MRCTGVNSWTSWILCVASAIVYCLLVPVYRVGGLFFVAVIEYYDVERDEAAIPFVVLTTARCLGGPLLGILAQKFTLRKTAFIGCFTAIIALFTTVFAKSILALSFSFGLYGLGMAATALLPCIIRSHFDENAITISNGVINLGPCMCALIFSPIIVHLLNVYGLPSTLMFSTGFVLNSIPFMMILKEFKNKSTSCESTTIQTNEIKDSSISKRNSFQKSKKLSNENSLNALNTDSKVPKIIVDKRHPFISCEETDYVTITSSFIDIKVSKCLKHNKIKCHCITNFMEKNNYLIDSAILNNDSKNLSDDPQSLTKNYGEKSHQFLDESESLDLKENSAIITRQNKIERLKDGSRRHILTSTIAQEDSSIVSSKANKELENEKRKTLRNSLNALTDLSFVILLLITGLFAYTYNILLTTIIDYSRDKGIDQSKEVYILMFSPIADIIGRLAFTWVTDKNYLSYSSCGIILFIIMGISSTWIALSKDFIMYTLAVMILTAIQGMMLNIFPGMTYAYIDKDKQILSVSSIAVLYAPLSFTVSPLIGYFRGKLGSYDGLYYLLTVTNLVGGLLVLLLPRFSKARE